VAIGERLAGPIFLGANGQRMGRHGAGRTVRRVARSAAIDKPIGPHTLRHAQGVGGQDVVAVGGQTNERGIYCILSLAAAQECAGLRAQFLAVGHSCW